MALHAAPSHALEDIFYKSRTPRQRCSKKGCAETHMEYTGNQCLFKRCKVYSTLHFRQMVFYRYGTCVWKIQMRGQEMKSN